MALRGACTAFCFTFLILASPSFAATFVVNSTADTSDASAGDGLCDAGAGVCTLRAAIEEANAFAGADAIHFAIGSGAQTISFIVLPAISEAVTIDGSTQPGYAGVPLIELDGTQTNPGLQLSSNGSMLRALLVNDFLNGIVINGSGNTVENCIIGTNATHTQDRGNDGDGITINGGSNNVIRENVIAFSNNHGVSVYESANFSFPTFTALIPDQTLMVPSADFTDDCGSFRHSAGATILDASGRAFNENFGMRLTATMSISMSGSYTFQFANLDDQGLLLIDGVEVLDSGAPPVMSATIFLGAGDHSFELDFWEGGGAARLLLALGGPATPTFNFSGNPGMQAELFQGRIPAEGNTITENSIFDNGLQGIALSCCCRDVNDAGDVDAGPNTFLNYPIFLSRILNPNGTITLDGTAPPNAIVEVFGSTNDGFGFGGEGKLYAGTTTANGSGDFTITITLPQPYYSVTATATDAAGNTSEFSDNFAVPHMIVVTNTNDSGPGSFRNALSEAEGDGVESLITFDPSLAGATITALTPFGQLLGGNTFINGDINNDCAPDIELTGNGILTGLSIVSAGNTIRGMAINRFVNELIVIDGGPAQNNQIVCNHLGLNLAGTSGYATSFALAVRNFAASTLIERNRIAGTNTALLVQGASNVDVRGNIIGWPAAATPLGHGISVESGAVDVNIGNSIAANANTIARNGGTGIRILGSNNVSIRNNSIFDNGGLGIDLDGNGVTPNDSNGDPDNGSNTLQNFPVLTRAAATNLGTEVEGFLDTQGGSYHLDFYVNTTRDPSGYGEGATHVYGLPLNPGPFTITLPPLPAGSFITAIVDGLNGTSEFSLAKEVTAQPLAATELVAYPIAGGVELRWRDPNASETGFRIEMQQFASWNTLTNFGPNVTTWIDTNIQPGARRTYRVIATSPSGDAPPSNTAIATAFNNFALPLCREPAASQHNRAVSPSVAFDGTNGAIAYSAASGGRAPDIYFQRLNANGSPLGAPVQITNDDVPSTHPTLVWNGASYGLLWLDHLRAADGKPVAQLSFALLGPAGAKIRGDVRVTSLNAAGPSGEHEEVPLLWDGSGWGIFVTEASSGLPDVTFYRLDADGDVLVNTPLMQMPFQFDAGVSAAWNGSEYGVAWKTAGSLFARGTYFLRVQTNGTFSPAFHLGSDGWDDTAGTSVVWDGTGWAVAWDTTEHIALRRLDATGNPLGPEVRLSDDGPAHDFTPKLMLKPGGGYVVYTTTTRSSGIREIGRLEADANGQRVGVLSFVSPDDGFDSIFPRATFDGASFVVAWNESRVNAHEIADAIVDASGTPGTVFDITTTHTGTSASRWPSLLARNGFIVVFSEAEQNGARIDARFYQNGTMVHVPAVNGGNPARRVIARPSAGLDFAIVWTDRGSGGVHYDRLDQNGNSVIAGGVRIADADVDRGAGFDFDGEEFGVVWIDGGILTFQRMGHNTPIGVPVPIGAADGHDPQLQWIGSGWAVVWRHATQLWFARLDVTGALLVPPIAVTSGGATFDFDLRWTGQHLGLVWSQVRPGGTGGISDIDLFFTTLDANGFKQFTPVSVANTQHANRNPALAWDGTNFHVVYPDFATGLREIAVTPQGSIASTRFVGDHAEGRVAVAHDGATMAMAWEHQHDLFVQTTECLTATTPPACAPLSATFANGMVQLSWPNNAQSGILAFHLYRDGRLLTELLPNTFAYADGGFTPGATHAYELRSYNTSYIESAGCTPVNVTAGIVLHPATLPNARQNESYNQFITAAQGTSPYTFAVTNGMLPTGLTLAPDGTLSGTPSIAGPQPQFTITATDATSATGARTYLLRVCSASFLFPTVLPNPVANTAYSQTLLVQNSGGPQTFAVTSGALPPGLTLASNGTLSGTPTTLGAFNFTITATENTSCTTALAYSMSVVSGREPRDVRAEAQSNSAILVRWSRPQKGETGFRIERSFDGGNSWGSINIVGADVTSHLDQGLTPQVLVHYRVVALYGAESATSAMAAAITFPHGPTKICAQAIGPYHPRAQFLSVVHDGTRWAAAWTDRRDGRLEDIYFQFLDDTTGAPTGSPVLVTQTDMMSRFPTLRWNGTHFGLLYSEHMRGPAGEITSTTNFALLSSAGNLLRTGARIHDASPGGFINTTGETPLVWDGGGWGVFSLAATGSADPSNIYYRRLTPNGDIAVGPVQLTNTPHFELDPAAAWNGSEYGLTWVTVEGTTRKLWFARMQVSGTLIGTPLLLDQTAPNQFVYAPALIWNAGEWAVAWNFENDDEAVVRLRLLNPDGSPKTPVTRLSDDLVDPDDPPIDLYPSLMPKSGGGYFAFTASRSIAVAPFELARLEASAAGTRAGARVLLTPDNDTLGTNIPHATTDGTRFLIAHEQVASSHVEAASLVLDASGNVTSGPTLLTTGHSAGSSGGPATLVAMGADFGAIWTESNASGNQVYAKFYDGGGNLAATRFPLVPSTNVVNRIAATAVGHELALAWREGSNNTLRFGRFDSTGNPLMADVSIGNGSQPGIAWNGEYYGVAYFSGGLRFQRVATNGSLVGPTVFIGQGQPGLSPLVQWVDRGWAVVWRSGTDLSFALLDRNGAFIIAPLPFTFTSTLKTNVQVAWSGDRLGVVWREQRGGDPPGQDIWFTALKLDGTKAFFETAVGSTAYADNAPAIYWDHDRFRIVYSNGAGATRELTVLSDGTMQPGERILHNRQHAMSVAFNGTSMGMLFNSLFDLTIQTTSCLDDATAPPCPNLTASFDGTKVHLTWPGVFDNESGIGAYNVYRDGTHLAELLGNTLVFDDFGFVSGAMHVYEVRAVNRALRASSGCTTRTIAAGVSVNPVTLPNGSVNSNYNATVAGTGGTAPYTFAVTAGALPSGVALNANSGALSGVVTAAGLFEFTITATDALAQSGSRAYSVRICSGISLFPTVLTEGFLANAYSQTVVASGAVGSANMTITAGALPESLTLDATGWIHGTPTATGTFNFTVSATDSIGCSTSRAYTIVISTGSAARNLSALALSVSSIRLRWTDPQRNENGFRIERSANFGGSWTPITIVGANATMFTDTALSAATAYTYRVVATTPSGDAPPSNAGTATTWPATAAKSCIQQVSPYHSFARASAVTRAGSQWAMAYQDRSNGENDEIWFTLLDANGEMTGTPLRLSNNDSVSLRPSIQWNGTNIGVVWTEPLRGPNGELHSPYRFALLDGSGNIIRNDVRLATLDGASSMNSDPQFVWDGSAWSFVESHSIPGNNTDLLLYRFDEDGDLLSDPINLTSHPDAEFGHAIAWNGSEYGISWLRGTGPDQTAQFQRFSSSGSPFGSPIAVNSFPLASLPDVVASPGGGWAVTWSESADDVEAPAMMRRFDAAGAPLGAATRISDDTSPFEVTDLIYDTIAIPSGGYAILTRLFTPAINEVGFLRADASGNRLGARVVVSPGDAFHSGAGHFAFDGTHFLITFNEGRLGTQELASVVVDSSGATVAGPTDLTSGHSLGNTIGFITTSNHQLATLGGGFVATWNELVPGDTQLYAKIVDGSGAVSATKFPLTMRGLRSRAGIASAGSTFAVAFRDATNAIAFCRYDANGNPLMSETTPVTGAAGPAVLLGFDGENYALLWVQNTRMQFQRVSPAGVAIGARSTLAPQLAGNAPVQFAWTGSGWAIVYSADSDLHFLLLDTSGAVIGGPVRVTFTPAEAKTFIFIAFSGDSLGVAYSSAAASGPMARFTVLGLDGIKLFNEVSIAEGSFGTNAQSLLWANDRFRLIYTPGELGTMKEVDFNPAGAQLGAARTISNRGGAAAAAWNGVTSGVLWATLAELFFQTAECLTDATPPACPAVNATRDASGVTLTWTTVGDAQSGIYHYYVWRDGALIGETSPSTTSYLDSGVRPGDEHAYRVSAANGAYRESTGCSTLTLVGSPSALTAAAQSAAQVQIAWQPVAGATSYQIERSADGIAFMPVGTSPSAAYSDGSVASQTSYLYRVRAVTPQQTSAPSNVDLATTMVFTDDPLGAGITVKSIHVTELRAAVNSLRTLAQLAPATYSGGASAGSPIVAAHVLELRTALNEARTALALSATSFTNAVHAGAPVRAATMQEIRNAVK
ncbi:MAG TPA: putative Ig domain-containing protein [Thermoanaerobaculia bacterium]|nr:putative Ig domain-containing protein [Thermoanaerobaculia bacterium]